MQQQQQEAEAETETQDLLSSASSPGKEQKTVPVSLPKEVPYQLCDKEPYLGVGSSGDGGCYVLSTPTVKAVSTRANAEIVWVRTVFVSEDKEWFLGNLPAW